MNSEVPRDSDLVERIRTGDATALALFYDRYNAVAYGLASHILRDAGAAEEVVEDVFLSVWRQPPTGQVPHVLKPWVLGHVRVQAIARLRAAHAVVPRETRAAAEEADQTQEGRSLHAALTRLPGAQQQALLLAYFGGLTHEEIARALAVSDGGVRRTLRGALQTLRRDLQAQGMLPRS